MRLLAIFIVITMQLAAEVSIEGSVEDRFAIADAVCRGRIDSSPPASDEGQTDAAGKLKRIDYYVDVSVEWCYKGENRPRQVRVWFLQRNQMWGPPAAGVNYVLMFLVRRQDAFVPATLLDSFAVFWAIPPPEASGENGLPQLQSDILQFVDGSDSQRSRDALALLLGFRKLSPKVSDRLQQISANANGGVRIGLLAAQVLATTGQKRRDAWTELAGALQGQSPQLIPGIESISAAVVNETSIDDLGGLEEMAATFPIPSLRVSAMLGIRKLAAKKSMPFLVEQLNAADTDVQYQALITLAEMTGKGGDYGPGMDLFERDPAKYKRLWADWWKNEGTGSLQ
jgi:hypothetical protein